MCIDIIMKGSQFDNQTFCANSREIFSSKILEIYHTHCSKLVKFKFYELKFEILCTRLVLVR